MSDAPEPEPVGSPVSALPQSEQVSAGDMCLLQGPQQKSQQWLSTQQEGPRCDSGPGPVSDSGYSGSLSQSEDLYLGLG